MTSNAMKRMLAARTALVLDQRFWGTLALKLKLVEDPTCSTAWVDGVTLGFNPEYVEALPTAAHVTALMAHEVGHCVSGHPWRREGRDAKKWNEACDRTLNPMLRTAGFHLPDGVLFELDPSHLGKSTEWVYNRLPQQNDDAGAPEPGQDSGGTGDNSAGPPEDNPEATNDGDPSPVGSDDTDEAQGAADEPFGGEVRDAPADTEAGEEDDAAQEERGDNGREARDSV